ncbi:MAG: hypothetical protein ACTS68_01410 [Candidatus Hodgkinia cicadicola]
MELRWCYREVFDSIVNVCKFPQPIGAILKSCWGNQSSLDVPLAILTKNANHVYPPLIGKLTNGGRVPSLGCFRPIWRLTKCKPAHVSFFLLEAAAKMINIPSVRWTSSVG